MKTLKSKEAITVLEDMKIDIPIPKATVTQIKRNVALNMAIDALLGRSEISNDSDTISRQDAIDAIGEEPEVWSGNDEYAQGLNNQWHYDVNAIKAVPPAEPEIIRCWECKHWGKRGLCDKWDNFIGNGDFYCGCAEMKEGGADG